MREAYFSEKGDKGSRCFNRRNVMQKTHDKKNCQSKTLIKKKHCQNENGTELQKSNTNRIQHQEYWTTRMLCFYPTIGKQRGA